METVLTCRRVKDQAVRESNSGFETEIVSHYQVCLYLLTYHDTCGVYKIKYVRECMPIFGY